MSLSGLIQRHELDFYIFIVLYFKYGAAEKAYQYPQYQYL